MQRNFKDYFIIALKGIAMGAADVVPGVSGGTIAFISGIYEELISSINKVNLSALKLARKEGIKKAWIQINGSFLASLFLGIAISIFSLAKGIKWLLETNPILLWSFFFGLVIASIIYVGKQIFKWNLLLVVGVLIGTIISYIITISNPIASPDSNLYLLFCGSIAIIAMILPGISGAFILVLLGAYEIALETVNQLGEGLSQGDFEKFGQAFVKFLMLLLGAIIGIKLFSKILTWMFSKYKDLTLALLSGFMVGSLNKIWPWKETLSWRSNSHGEQVPLLEKSISPASFDGDNQLVLAIVLAILGFLTIFILEKIANKTSLDADTTSKNF